MQQLREALEAGRPVPVKSLDTVVKIVTQWPYGDRLAGLDLLRCIARFPSVAKLSGTPFGSALDLAIRCSVPADTAVNENAAMMGMRTVANLFATADGRSVMAAQASEAIGFLERVVGIRGGDAIGKFNRNVLIAATTCAVNYSVLVNKEKQLTPELRRRLFVVVGALLDGQSDSEVLYRGLVALGTCLLASKEAAGGLSVADWISGAQNRASEERVRAAAGECLAYA